MIFTAVATNPDASGPGRSRGRQYMRWGKRAIDLLDNALVATPQKR